MVQLKHMHGLRLSVVVSMVSVAAILVAWRGCLAIKSLRLGEPSEFLAYPLSVILPALMFAFLVGRRTVASEEGALMQVGAMIQLLLIIALPSVSLYLALGFPVVFLVVELFETKMPSALRQRLKGLLIA